MDDTSDDKVLQPLNAAIRSVIPGRIISPSTKSRWYTRGLAGLDGERIRLPVWYVGRQPHTTRAAIKTWLNEVTAARLARIDSRHGASPDVSDEALRAAGLLGRSKGGAK